MIGRSAAWDRLADALEYPEGAAPEVRELYVDTFDLDPSCSLEAGWHLFGESPERGAFLSILRADLARAGIDERGNLPDHLSNLLRLIAREDDESAAALAAIIRPAVRQVLDRVRSRVNLFADPLAEVVRALDACQPALSGVEGPHEERP